MLSVNALRRVASAVAAALVFMIAVRVAVSQDPDDFLPEKALPDSELVTLHLKNVDLLRAIELLLFRRGLNLVAPPNTGKRVSVRLRGVHWRDALDVILRQAGMSIEIVGNIARIDTIERILASPLRVEYSIRHLEKADAESLAKTTLSTSAGIQVVEAPRPPGQPRRITLILTATGPDQDRMRSVLKKLDVPSHDRPVRVTPLSPPGTYSVRIDDMPIGRALDQLGSALGFSAVFDDPPRGRASGRLDRVTVPELLDAILSPLGFSFDLTDNVLRVGESARFRTRVRSRVIRLKHANPLQVKPLLRPLLSPAGKIEVLGEGEAAQATAAIASTAPTAERTAGSSATVTGLRRAGGLRATTGQRTQPPSEVLLVSDTSAVLAQIEATVRQLDRPAAVVEIETQLVEASLNGDVQLGISWDANISANGASGSVVRFPLSKGHVAGQTLNNSFTLGTLSAANFNLMLRALSRDNKVKVLSAPRVATVSHEPARILIGQRFPITMQQSNNQVNIQTTTLDYYEEVGIALTVTPRVTGPDQINLVMKPEVSSIASLIDNRFPVIDTREAETRVNLKSGHTAVIGGMLQDRSEKITQGLPGLSRLPVVGRLFGQGQKRTQRTELLVCVTPRVQAAAPELAVEDRQRPLAPPSAGPPAVPRDRPTDPPEE